MASGRKYVIKRTISSLEKGHFVAYLGTIRKVYFIKEKS
jgi:hypothetical protein